jgi:hypothetical protein
MTPTPTRTPTSSPIFCGSGTTTGSHFYTDCCGNFIVGSEVGLVVTLDYTRPSNGVSKSFIATSVTCPTPSQTPTNTPTPTLTPTPTNTPTPTLTPSITPSISQTPSKTPQYELVNECNVFSSFPMGVSCFVVSQPTSSTSLDGILSLKITGGTSPYSVFWSNGQSSQTLTGIPAGTYEATVVDYYGDYSANTICSLFAPSPTPTSTPTITPTSSPEAAYPQLCFTLTNNSQVIGPLQFSASTFVNGKPSYESNSYVMYWNTGTTRWEILNWNYEGLPASTNSSNIPISAWSLLGGSQPTQISVVEGICPAYSPLISSVSIENNTCGKSSNCDGSIIISASGGFPPYSYSINGGVSFQLSNIFNGLCSNTYQTVVKDSANNQQTSTAFVGIDQLQKNYILSINVDSVIENGPEEKTTKWSISVNPELEVGVTISFNMNVSTFEKVNGPGNGVITTFNEFYKNGSFITPINTTTDFANYTRPNCSPEVTTEDSKFEVYSIAMVKGDTLTGTTLANAYITGSDISPNGCSTLLEQNVKISLSNATINGCSCCNIVLDTTSPETFLILGVGNSTIIE